MVIVPLNVVINVVITNKKGVKGPDLSDPNIFIENTNFVQYTIYSEQNSNFLFNISK